MASEKIIGIDLGTTNSCVAVIEGGQPIIIPNSEGYATTPSVVALTKEGERLVGQLAKRQAVTNPERTIQAIKRHMGTNHRVEIDHRSYSPEQVSAMILQKLKKQAQDFLGQRVTRAIITVPAYFDDAQRLATRDAGEIAGLEVVRIINEPTACALTYGLKRFDEQSNLVVFDFGGGTFDVTILQLGEQVLHVRATCGNNRLGGDDFDERIMDWIAAEFRHAHGIDPSGNAGAVQRMKEAAESAKIELSGKNSADVRLPFLAFDGSNPLHFEGTVLVQEFERMTEDLVQAVAIPVQMALADARMKVSDIDHVILVGGTTRIPAVQAFIRDFFQKEPLKSVNPDEAVAMGAAIQGGILAGEVDEMLLVDVLPITVGLELGNGGVNKLFDRNSTIPLATTRAFTTARDDQTLIVGHIVQGESETASRNKSLSRFEIHEIAPGPARSQQVSVSFSIDADGILSVSAHDAHGKQKPVVMHRTHGLSREGLSELAREEARQAEERERAEDRQTAVIRAQSLLSDAERTCSRHAEELDPGQVESMKRAISSLREAVAAADTADIVRRTDSLEELLSRCARSLISARSLAG